jgi:hypothetical protein
MAYRYDVRTGVTKIKLNIKKYVAAAAIALGIAGASVAPAMAVGNSANSSASPCGATHGAFADQNGNFGFLGEVGGTPGYHNGAVGQEAGATGYNNSQTNCQQ